MRYFWTLILGMFLGAAVAGWWYAPGEKVETPAVAERQPDGSLVLERQPDTKPRNTAVVPKGGKVVREIRVDVQPARADCPACSVELSLVRMRDDSMRAVAWSPSGEVLGGIDVPIVPLRLDRDLVWAAGISRGTGEESWGGWLDRDFGPVRIGGAFNKIDENARGENRYEARFKIGLRF